MPVLCNCAELSLCTVQLTPAYSVQKQLEFLVSSTAARDNGRYVGIEGKDTPW